MVKKSIFLVGVVLGLFTMTGEYRISKSIKRKFEGKRSKRQWKM